MRRPQSAFTLVELLVTITIIAILASMIVGASALSMGQARQARTEALVARLHTLLAQHYDSFRHRRVELDETKLSLVGVFPNPQYLAYARLYGTREQLKRELPDRWSDILGRSLGADGDTPPPANAAAPVQFLAERPAITNMYLRRYESIRQNVNSLTESSNTAADLRRHQGAECLYLIIMLAAGDGESAGLFKESDIGDTDGDGAPEFIDSWGNPIEFLRWAPGFESSAQVSFPGLAFIYQQEQSRTDDATADQVVKQYLAANPDPFDLYRIDSTVASSPFNPATGEPARGLRLVPLIYSAGADQEYGLVSGADFAGQNVRVRDFNNWLMDRNARPALRYKSNVVFEQAIDPYLSSSNRRIGDVIPGGGATDNIHNHNIEGR